jgi:hypothetical protein
MRKIILMAAVCGLFLPVLASAQDKINFEKQIYPFIKSGCVKCHRPEHENPDRPGRKIKPKGGYVFTNPEGISAAANEDGKKFIVAGKPEESRMHEVTVLPIDDENHYPPEGDAPQWTDAEKELFAKWITEGADFGGWKGDPDPTALPVWDGKEKEAGTTETAK